MSNPRKGELRILDVVVTDKDKIVKRTKILQQYSKFGGLFGYGWWDDVPSKVTIYDRKDEPSYHDACE